MRCHCLEVGDCISGPMFLSPSALVLQPSSHQRQPALRLLVSKVFLDLASTSNEPFVLQVFRADAKVTPSEKSVSCRRPFQRGAATLRLQLAHIRQHYPVSQATRHAKLDAITMVSYNRTIFDFDPLLKASRSMWSSLFVLLRIFRCMLDVLRARQHPHADASP
ncbi:hypothetical protein EDB89DRAFT_2067429 [Lactarius sanguifluus]|nr:hypothetical protein EDB89DRAFT_2067429 [Lactarius sanguifluus]